MKTKAYEHANGLWYVSGEDDQGFHHEPVFGGTMTEAQAKREAHRRNHGPLSVCEEIDRDFDENPNGYL